MEDGDTSHSIKLPHKYKLKKHLTGPAEATFHNPYANHERCPCDTTPLSEVISGCVPPRRDGDEILLFPTDRPPLSFVHKVKDVIVY